MREEPGSVAVAGSTAMQIGKIISLSFYIKPSHIKHFARNPLIALHLHKMLTQL